MSAATEDAGFVAAEIERLARNGASAGELLGMLPVDGLRVGLRALDLSYDILRSEHLLGLHAVLRVEIDSRD